ncbi:MAG: GNAT family N-acetyltransferase [Mycobacteriales bacterium]
MEPAPPIPPTELTAGRLHLRPWQPGDEPALVEAGADPEIQRWTSLPAYTAEQARDYVTREAPLRWANGEHYAFAVCDSTSGAVLASVALRPGGAPGVGDVGFWCLPAARGGAVAADAVAALSRWAFGAQLAATRLVWKARVGHWASRRVAEKAGFRFEGLLRQGIPHRGELVDGWVGGLLAQDPVVDTAVFPRYDDRSDGVVTLRRWRSSDGPDVARACADPESARWLPLPVPYTAETGQAYVDEIVPADWAGGVAANVAVTAADSGRLLGAIGLRLLRGGGQVGYWTAPWARGRGVATRACVLHARWGLEVLGLPRLELLADVGNVASQRVAERAGFAREGVARAARPVPRTEARADMVVFARLPGDLPPER